MARYKRLDTIGVGGQGRVYRAERFDDRQLVALKYLSEDANDAQQARFAREVRMQAPLNHPHIVPILGSRLNEMPYFFAMPLASSNLRKRLEQGIGTDLALSYFEQILAGVEHAHANGVVHRDLKPENVLLFDDLDGEYAAVSDFGSGKELDRETPPVTGSGAFVGTRGYAAPEQFGRARDVDATCDVYALGVILYELLTGRAASVPAKFGTLPSGLGYVVERCIHQIPGERYESAAELRRDFTMFTARTELFEAPEQAVKRLIEGFTSESVALDEIIQLNRIFRENLGDELLLMRAFPRLPDSVLHTYLEYSAASFKQVLQAYDKVVSVPLPFEYCDVVGRFYRKLYYKLDDSATRRLLLGRLLDVGVGHNRFFVINVVVDMLAEIRDPGEAAVARDALYAHRHECLQLKSALLSTLRLPFLRAAVEDVAGAAALIP